MICQIEITHSFLPVYFKLANKIQPLFILALCMWWWWVATAWQWRGSSWCLWFTSTSRRYHRSKSKLGSTSMHKYKGHSTIHSTIPHAIHLLTCKWYKQVSRNRKLRDSYQSVKRHDLFPIILTGKANRAHVTDINNFFMTETSCSEIHLVLIG